MHESVATLFVAIKNKNIIKFCFVEENDYMVPRKLAGEKACVLVKTMPKLTLQEFFI